jgi:predicted neutral ceramidase superfamily lipid hydrolase
VSLNLIKRTVLECVLTYIVFMILSWLIIDRVIIKHSEMILVSSIVLVISKYLYENTKKYIIAMIIIIFSIMSPIIIKLLIGENIYLDSINRYLGFFISILNLIFILGYYIRWIV